MMAYVQPRKRTVLLRSGLDPSAQPRDAALHRGDEPTRTKEDIHETSRDHILTSHVGSLPRPDGLIAANRAREAGEATDEAAFQQTLRAAVADVVRRQQGLGIDIPGDGEFGKSMGQRVNYGSWWSYSFQRLGGLELGTARRSTTCRRAARSPARSC